MVLAAKSAASTADREIILSRTFDAPRPLVFEVWGDPKHVTQWWGGTEFRITFHAFDMRVGGRWVFTMHGTDGTDWPNWIEFKEIVKPERLAYSHGGDPNEPAHFEVVVTFEALGKQTRVTQCSTFPTAAARDYVVKEHNAIEIGKQHLEQLVQYVAQMQAAGR